MPAAKLHRRRGTSSSKTGWNVWQSSIALLACVALTLTLGMIGLMFTLPGLAAHHGAALRGHAVEPAAAAAAAGGDVQLIQSVHHLAERQELANKLEFHNEHARLRHGKDERLRERDQHIAHAHQAEPAAKQPDAAQLDLGRYDGPPTKTYPYPLDPTLDDYDIESQYRVLGGYRYSEYTTGGTPYILSEELRKRSDAVARSRRPFIKKAMQFAWQGYVKYAFGQDEVLPQSARGSNNWGGQGITLVDSLDTLWLMGLKDEFWQARDWVRDHLSHDNVGSVSVFETTIRDLGGLLAAYDWSGDTVFLTKARELGTRLARAFEGTSTGIPFGQVNLATGKASNIGWTGGNAIVAEAGTLQIEFRYLAKVANLPDLATKSEHVYTVLKKVSRPDGLFPYYIRNNPKGSSTPEFANDKITFGAMGDSLYEYMLKIWIQGGRQEPLYREMYDLAIDSMHKELLQTSTPSGLAYIADKNSGQLDHKMDHLVCFMGGLLALGAYLDPLGLESERAQRDLRTGKALAYTCYQMYARMNTGISAEFVQFYDGRDFEIGRGAPHYLLRPEAFESFFILNQLTGDPVYREWGWEAFQSIEKYCKTKIGYGSLSNVQDTNGKPRDKMESFFLAETIKYLYLLQDPDTEVDLLHKHVFNTEAHPLRIFPVMDAKTS